MAPDNSAENVHFTVLIRLPFPRGDFIDPSPVDWSAVKDRTLWDILSRPSSKGDDINWQAIADHFDVTLPFLLQQAAWLYDRQLSQVRAQMLRVGNTHSNTPPPSGPTSNIGSSAIGGAQTMKRAGSGGSRVPSRLSTIQNTNPLRTESSSSTATRTRVSAPIRTSSTNTVTQALPSRDSSPRPVPPTSTIPQDREQLRGNRAVVSAGSRRPSVAVLQKSPILPSEPSSDESSDESDDEVRTRRMPGTKRLGRFSSQKPSFRDQELDFDDDDSPAFLPFSGNRPDRNYSETTAIIGGIDLTARDPNTLAHLSGPLGNNTQPRQPRPTDRGPSFRRHPAVVSLDSSASSTGGGGEMPPGALGSPPPGTPRRDQRTIPGRPGQQRPRTTGSTASQPSPRRPASGKESSEDTPSMGSSFSDLDDASVTQSALEEALLSNMQHGGMASRMSSLSQALRSRYL